MERSLARSNVYCLLSLCFSYPDDDICERIAEGKRLREARRSLVLLADDHFETCLRAFEDVSCGLKKATQREMAQEYTGLFINAFPRIVPLRGSVCRGEKGLAFEETTSEVLRFFRDAGFTPKREDVPGHMADQLEFMGSLAKQESKASLGERIRLEEIQLDFLSRCLIAGVSAFCQKVKEGDVLPFYCVLGDLTQEVINFEINYLGMPEEKGQDRLI